MNRTQAVIAANEDHNEVDCCPIHWFAFNAYLGMVNQMHDGPLPNCIVSVN